MADDKGKSPNPDESLPTESTADESGLMDDLFAVLQDTGGPLPDAEEEAIAAPTGELPDTDRLSSSETEVASETEAAEEPAKEEPKEEWNWEKQPSKSPKYLELAGAIGVPLLVLALAWLGFCYFSTACYVIALVSIPYGVWKVRGQSTVYTLLLAGTLAALLTAAYWMWIELGRYHFDIKAQQRAAVSAAKWHVAQPPSAV